MTRDIIVSTTPQETKVALLEDGSVSELFIEREAQRGVVGNIYKGRVTGVLPGMQSAFVELGLERDTFLHAADVFEGLDENLLTPEERAGARERQAPIEELLREGQELVVQVLKEPLGQKGARITSHVSLPGRYLVFMPTVEHVGVSRKIVDEDERKRLKALLKELRQERGGGGFIARTAGQGRSREDFERDARYLTRSWDEVRAVASRERAPALLHHELSLVQRLLRDLLSDDVGAVKLDSEREFQRTLELVSQLQPELTARVRLHSKPGQILDEHGVSAELERALRPKVWLASGGYIVINQTEALVAIDVNTGRNVGKKRLEDTLLETNLEAAREIVRQIRLRDLGGIIVVDFIDMDERKSRRRVTEALEQELKRDRSPSKMLEINEFGLVIITRKRVRQSLERTLCEPCPYCAGSGMIKSVATVCTEIYDELRKLADDLRGHGLLLRVNPEVARALQGGEQALLKELHALVDSPVQILGDPLLHQEQFDVVLRRGLPLDPELERYVAAIEAHLGRRRGREQALSPPDFAQARAWHAAGLPLASVLAGIDEAGAVPPRSLRACRRAVERLAPPSARARPPQDQPGGRPAGAACAGFSELAGRLELLARRAPRFEAAARLARELLGSPGSPAAPQAGRRAALFAELQRAARAASGAAQERQDREGLERAAARQAAQLSPAQRAAALERALTRLALERFGLGDLA